jgi:hypothetical protein
VVGFSRWFQNSKVLAGDRNVFLEKTTKWRFLPRFFFLKEWGSENVSIKLYLEISKIDEFTVV